MKHYLICTMSSGDEEVLVLHAETGDIGWVKGSGLPQKHGVIAYTDKDAALNVAREIGDGAYIKEIEI